MANVLSLVAVILAVVALVIGFAIPGPMGSSGAAGTDGAAGATGAQGATGPQGPTGLRCWDLNGDGVANVTTEDTNGDTAVDVLDCRGAVGPQGPQGVPGVNGTNGLDGIHCWDLNANGVADPAEDINLDTVVDVRDCAGSTGPAGPGTIMAYGEVVNTVAFNGCTNFISVSITVPQTGSIVLTSSLHVWIDHTVGTEDVWAFMVRQSAVDCGLSFADPTASIIDVPSPNPTDSINMAGALVNMYAVGAPGTYTYYLNTEMAGGENPGDTIVNGSLAAVFYPS